MEPEADGLKCMDLVACNPQGIAGRRRKGSDDAVLGQLMQLQVIEGLPGANDSDVCNREEQRCMEMLRPLQIRELV